MVYEITFYQIGGVIASKAVAGSHADALKVVAKENPESFSFVVIRKVESCVSSCMDTFGDYEYAS